MTNTMLELDREKTVGRDTVVHGDLLTRVQDAMSDDFSKLAGQLLGESPGAIQSALASLVPVVLGSVAQKGATPESASDLLSLINSANLDVTLLGDIARLFGGSGADLRAGTSSLVPALFGDKSGAHINALSSASGIKSSSATILIAIVVPLILTVLKKYIGDKGLDARSLASLLANQVPKLQGALDSRMTNEVGLARPAAPPRGPGGQAPVIAKRSAPDVRAGGPAPLARTSLAATTATRSGLMRWLPWLIGAAAVLALWNMFSGKLAPTTAPVMVPQTAAPAPTPTTATVSFPAKVYFDVGTAAVSADGLQTIAAVADTIKGDNLKVAITGYTDKTGDVAANEELAKSRTTSVRDALKSAGVAEANMEVMPPFFVEVGAGGSDVEARRVEINKQ